MVLGEVVQGRGRKALATAGKRGRQEERQGEGRGGLVLIPLLMKAESNWQIVSQGPSVSNRWNLCYLFTASEFEFKFEGFVFVDDAGLVFALCLRFS